MLATGQVRKENQMFFSEEFYTQLVEGPALTLFNYTETPSNTPVFFRAAVKAFLQIRTFFF